MDRRFTQVEFGPHMVDVPEGGYYDRFRLNPDLDAVARDPAAGNIDFFRRIPKRQVMSRVGLTWAPNFYYRSSSIQLLFLAPRNVELVRHGGPLSQLLDGLGASTIMRLDVVKDAQLVLNLPTPLTAFDEPGKPR
ncbi:hypothetical protein [Burkholderia cenocepacia]|uniref:Acetoacetate decarboxylase n=1 Tax=Burkholderia cenocepacia TaxID=95486 RepID=A0A3Q9F9E4_9BURK|nr:hypothetical protein [Burkholderia cenocepacia]AZQ52828.1 hypothetical protein D5R55_17585 [Burkholderia cenocepacia]